MGGSFKIGRFSGIDVRVHWTFLVLLAFYAFVGYRASGSPTGALTATVAIVALFVCVLLHEFGHSLVAQRLGIGIRSITLPVTENGELVGMLTIEDIGQASLLGPLPKEAGRIDSGATSRQTTRR